MLANVVASIYFIAGFATAWSMILTDEVYLKFGGLTLCAYFTFQLISSNNQDENN